ncbi:hypothetical protein ACL02U_08995 [Streptomyces sp. MS06]|uniref:hypothetical protein n=1 Tax=Streptomyces sp. MS06 TaxID=3385974 RepID=UPI00399F40EB
MSETPIGPPQPPQPPEPSQPTGTSETSETPAVPAVPAAMEPPASPEPPAAPATPADPAVPDPPEGSADAPSASLPPAEPAAHLSDPEAPSTPVRRPRRARRIAAAAGCLLLAGAVVAGVGYTVVTVRGADRDAGAPQWKLPTSKPAQAGKTSPKGLAGMLVPYGTSGWKRGPDIGAYGADARLSAAEATAYRKKSLQSLPRTQRKLLEKEVDREHVTGMAMRSYVSEEATNYNYDATDSYTVTVALSRMGDKGAAREIVTSQTRLLDALDVFRKGPSIEGHKNARCYLLPVADDGKLDTMMCSAYVGDVLLTATAHGVKPLGTDDIVTLLGTQLNRIKEQGVAV